MFKEPQLSGHHSREAAPPATTRRDRRDTMNVRGRTTSVFDRLGGAGVGAIDPPFTLAIMASPYQARCKMPSMASYDGSTDADEHLENYQAHMLIQNANEASLCKYFCLTLTGAARQCYWRLVSGSISSFKQLADAFLAAFLGLKTIKMETSYLFGIKQGES
ncbi:hypothetical protein TIFTF001_017401 [Ficus carica]|uniref:Retrotransposon gag domain-containing protein n=1 Tax=Ficus carica TaxID=3494 RepID=A0AA88AQM2_FICCA|nr:hypothetical protein TIFTF001_017401 [Ficus carica]